MRKYNTIPAQQSAWSLTAKIEWVATLQVLMKSKTGKLGKLGSMYSISYPYTFKEGTQWQPGKVHFEMVIKEDNHCSKNINLSQVRKQVFKLNVNQDQGSYNLWWQETYFEASAIFYQPKQ